MYQRLAAGDDRGGPIRIAAVKRVFRLAIHGRQLLYGLAVPRLTDRIWLGLGPYRGW
jgi:hypothetical protein